MGITVEGILVGAIVTLVATLTAHRIVSTGEPEEDPRAQCLECGAPEGADCDPECGVYDPEPRDG